MTSVTDLSNPRRAQAPATQPGRGSELQSAISFQDVSKHFAAADGSPLEVLRGVSFDLPVGDIVAIVGPSGSGKSTLLNMAAGLLLPDRGRVVIMGQGTDAAVDWSKVGYMFQDDRLLPWRVAIQNVALALEAGPMSPADRLRRPPAVIDFVPLGRFSPPPPPPPSPPPPPP